MTCSGESSIFSMDSKNFPSFKRAQRILWICRTYFSNAQPFVFLPKDSKIFRRFLRGIETIPVLSEYFGAFALCGRGCEIILVSPWAYRRFFIMSRSWHTFKICPWILEYRIFCFYWWKYGSIETGPRASETSHVRPSKATHTTICWRGSTVISNRQIKKSPSNQGAAKDSPSALHHKDLSESPGVTSTSPCSDEGAVGHVSTRALEMCKSSQGNIGPSPLTQGTRGTFFLPKAHWNCSHLYNRL